MNFFLILCTVCIHIFQVCATQFPSIELSKISYSDLLLPDGANNFKLALSLVTFGAVQIVDIPLFSELRKNALSELAGCLTTSKSPISKLMSDGSVRRTVQAASVDGVAGEMSDSCGDASSNLRATVDATMRQLFMALDKSSVLAGNTSPVMTPYKSYNALMQHGDHLEHLHSYYASNAVDSEGEKGVSAATVNYHTDAGLMIAMTAGYYSASASEESGLYIELPTGVKARAIVEDDALIVMVGDGGARWLAPVLGTPLRAVPHALVAGLKSGSAVTRSWYGKMYLPPSDAIVPQENISFKQYQSVQSKAVATMGTSYAADSLPSACGGVQSGYIQSSSTDCGAGEIDCWMQCMPVGDIWCGTNAVCMNPATGQITDGKTDTCTTCIPMCVGTNVTTFDGYCYGNGVSMYMAGFTSIVKEGKSNTECLNLLFTAWTLDSSVKFGFACFGVLLFGIFIQFLTKLRFDISKKPTSHKNNAILVGLHTTQIVSGYFIMLIAMTYSVELFCMVCLGLAIGFALFNLKSPPSASTDPCCPPDEEDEKNGLKTPFMTNVVNSPIVKNNNGDNSDRI